MIPADREPGLKVSPRQGDRSSLSDGWHPANPQGAAPSWIPALARGSQEKISAHPSGKRFLNLLFLKRLFSPQLILSQDYLKRS